MTKALINNSVRRRKAQGSNVRKDQLRRKKRMFDVKFADILCETEMYLL